MTDTVSAQDRGLSLIELVLAMALFALVAVLGLQALTASLKLRDGITQRYQNSADLARPVALLRQDLASIIPARFQPPNQITTQPALWTSADGTRLEMSIGGQIGLSRNGTLQPDALHRVIWRFDADQGILFRQIWPVLAPGNDTLLTAERPMMTGLTGIDLRSHWPSLGWQPGVSALVTGPVTLDEDNAFVGLMGDTPLPQAIEITLRLQSGGAIPLLEALQ